MRHCIGRGEGLRIDIRVARSFLGLEQIRLDRLRVAELVEMKRVVNRMVRDRREADRMRAEEERGDYEVQCPTCGNAEGNGLLGVLGGTEWYRCRACGTDINAGEFVVVPDGGRP
jgi:hypothetical protein